MKVLILGGDGYLGWPTAMDFAAAGHEVTVVDNYLRRLIAEETDSEALLPTPTLTQRAAKFKEISGHDIHVRIGDLADPEVMMSAVAETAPDTIIHYAEQPSAPYSMQNFKTARTTFKNNLDVTFNLIWAMIEHAPKAHMVKLGTMGEYGTPNIDIEEGWIDIEHKGRTGKFLFPRAAGSLYHTTKVLDTDLLWFYVRIYGLKVTDLMQGPVYGLSTDQADMDPSLVPNFHYDDIFGTVVNRFLVQAVAGIPLTVYGGGGQTRGYLNLRDTLQCVMLAAQHPAGEGELKIFNQLTETFSVNQIADKVQSVGNQKGLNVAVKSIPNPRKEMEEHYYNPSHSGLIEMGLKPHYMTDDVVSDMLDRIIDVKDRIIENRIMPRVKWK
ncbi:NAD-dependent epimerase/dehydratase family protein [Sulfitobacter geojensis]|uniref:NAD-dependent epimerase/dehydratase family protein n=1 Tax=Sulfitobacter geojensis TaxID=1342299 RepID=UPI00046896CD|nr:NAD-dependent epimerase/dehydratase family protein [Sulfitobacter geojensis]NYI27458.1 UDP-sulfoquinovose synthase [Sulfitobacter geojensis]